MKLNKSTNYALKILLCLQEKNKLKNKKEIVDMTQIPPKYLTYIMAKLRKAGYVDSVAGIKGGYFLTKDLSQISVYNILCIIDPPTVSYDIDSTNDKLCNHIKNYYYDVQRKLKDNIFSVTLDEILNYY